MNNSDDTQTRREVSRIKSENEQEILCLPNVTGVFTGTKVTDGVDTGEIAIVVTVSEKKKTSPPNQEFRKRSTAFPQMSLRKLLFR